MPKKSIRKVEPMAFSPKVYDSENHGIIILLSSICIAFVIAIATLTWKLDKSTKVIYEYELEERLTREREEFKQSCYRLIQFNSDFTYRMYSGYCYSSAVTLETKEEVEEAIRHYELGVGK